MTCEFCSKQHKNNNCSIDNLPENLTMRQVLGMMKVDRDFELQVTWNSNVTQANMKMLESPSWMEINVGNAGANG